MRSKPTFFFIAALVLLGLNPALGAEPFLFEKIISTADQNSDRDIVEISSPVFKQGKFYLKTISMTEDGEAFYSLYSYSQGGEMKLIFDSSQKLPETDDYLDGILDFDVRGDDVVFVGIGESDYTLGVYLWSGGQMTRIAGGSKKMPSRSLYFKEINDVMFLGDGILYTGGRKEREGLYFYRNGESTLLIHEPLEIWIGRKNLTHKKARGISKLNKIGDEIVLSLQFLRDGENVVEFFSIDGSGEVTPWNREEIAVEDFSEIFQISAITGTPNYQIFLGFGSDGLGRLYELRDNKPVELISNQTALWAEEASEVYQYTGAEIKPGDVIAPSREMFFRKASNSFPFWHNVYTIYEMEGILQPEYINQFAVMDEFLPLYEDRKGGRWLSTMFQAAISYYIGGEVAASIVVSQRNTIFSKHSTRGKMSFYNSRTYSWDNYFQVPLTAGDGGFATNGKRIIFHGVNLRNQQGLFLLENGEIRKILDNSDRLFNWDIAHLYIGFDAFQGDDIIFWVELTSLDGKAEQFLVRGKPNPDYQ